MVASLLWVTDGEAGVNEGLVARGVGGGVRAGGDFAFELGELLFGGLQLLGSWCGGHCGFYSGGGGDGGLVD